MSLIAHLTAHAASFSSHGPDGTVHFEMPWHRAELRLYDEAGALVRTMTACVDGVVDVGGAEEAPAPDDDASTDSVETATDDDDVSIDAPTKRGAGKRR